MDIAAWLRELGLERYEPAFRENEIDWEVLPELTEADLEKIGLPLGVRKKLFRAIAGLPGRSTAVSTEAALYPKPVAPDAERRQLTVMFVDLVGSTELSVRLDPEDLREVMRAYQAACARVIARFEGRVARFLGDGVLAYFGWPQAHEDDAERAVRAGLATVEEIGQLPVGSEARLAARIGIATGQVVVGDLTSQDAADKDAVIGEMPNLAARLQTLAEPGTVVIGQATRKLIGGLFELEDLGPKRLKGFAEPLAAWRVSSESRSESRFEALHGERLTPLVGREAEIALLLERWAHAKNHDGQVVLLNGEPGIGKSRIALTLCERLAEEPHVRLRYFCSPYHTDSALHPVLDQLGRAAGFVVGEPPEARLAKLDAVLRENARDVGQAVALLASLFSIPIGVRYPVLNLSPQRQRQRTLEVLVEQLEGLAARSPVLMIFEDAHWLDPTTLELLDLTVQRIAQLPVLLLITFRPEFIPPWAGSANVTQMSLNRLSHGQAGAMVERLAGGKALPAEVLEQIVARTDGVPLFVEELTKTVLESGLLTRAGDRFDLSGPLPPLAIPTTLHDSLMARLDRLAPVKQVAQVGAVIGREFSYELLQAAVELSAAELREALTRLVASELVFCRGSPPQAKYRFKHALIQDAAYESLLRSRRQQLQTRIAQILEKQFPETVAITPEVLAHHLTAAALVAEAAPYWLRAGQKALQRSAVKEAASHLTKGLAGLERMREGAARDQLEIGLQATLALALSAMHGYAAPSVERVYARAHELCRRSERAPQLFPVLYGLFVFHWARGNLRLARDFGEQLLGLAEQAADPALLLIGHSMLGNILWHLGDNVGAGFHLEEARGIYDLQAHGPLAFVYGQDFGVLTLCYAEFARLMLGYPDEALRATQEAVALARRLKHPFSLCMALAYHAPSMIFRHSPADAIRCAEECIAVAAEQGFPHWLAKATVYRGWALAQLGAARDGVEQIREGIAGWRAVGAEVALGWHMALMAESQLAMEEAKEALDTTGEALTWIDKHSERQFESLVHRIRGDAFRTLNKRDQASAAYKKALEVARQQQAKWWELTRIIHEGCGEGGPRRRRDTSDGWRLGRD